jgi:hypothetical protein
VPQPRELHGDPWLFKLENKFRTNKNLRVSKPVRMEKQEQGN